MDSRVQSCKRLVSERDQDKELLAEGQGEEEAEQ